MDLETLKKANELNSELENIKEVKRFADKHERHWWSLRFPGDDSVDINTDVLRSGIRRAVEEAEAEMLKKIGEL